jgi:hypothetical protein
VQLYYFLRLGRRKSPLLEQTSFRTLLATKTKGKTRVMRGRRSKVSALGRIATTRKPAKRAEMISRIEIFIGMKEPPYPNLYPLLCPIFRSRTSNTRKEIYL